MGYKSDVVQKAKFEYSPLGQVFNKGLDTSEKQVGLLKRLKNIEGKTDRQLEENKDNQSGVKSVIWTVKEKLSQRAKNTLEKLNNQEKLIYYKKLYLKGGNKVDYDFTNVNSLRGLFRTIYYRGILISGAEREQNNFDDIIRILKAYRPRKSSKYYKPKQDLLINAPNFYDGREMVFEAFKNKMFLLSKCHYYPDYVPEEDISSPKSSISSDSEDELLKQYDQLYKAVSNVDNKLDSELIKKYFNKGYLLELFKFLRYSLNKATAGAKQALIEANLFDLKRDIRNMSDDETKN